MRANPSPMSVADYCHDYNQKKIIVNDEYQRNDGLWTAQARSFFIESILLEYPIPKLYLHAKLDLKSRQQIKEVVDGQQRTQALVSFFNNKHRLTSNIDTEELRGMRYNQLDPSWQSRFLSYSLPIDQFTGAIDADVREAFRRMNANNIPLNDEEQRNARFQGPFKWFIVSIADKFKDSLEQIGLFSRRDLMRMSDLKMYSEIVLVLDEGFLTVKGRQLDNLYKKYNGTFDKQEKYGDMISEAITAILETATLHERVLLRSHVFQSMALAALASRHPDAVAAVDTKYSELSRVVESKGINLETLISALREPDSYPALSDFVNACTVKTNVEESKVTRFFYLRSALNPRSTH